MAKRSKRWKRERGQSGCMSSLINVFHFRHGRSTKRLLTDRKQVSEQAEGTAHSNHNIVSPPCLTSIFLDAEETKTPMADTSKPSVKKLMEEEMFDEKAPSDHETGHEQIRSISRNHMKKNRKKKRSSAGSSDPDFDLEKISQDSRDIDPRHTGFLSVDAGIVEDKFVYAVKLLNERRLSDGGRFGDAGRPDPEPAKHIHDFEGDARLSKTDRMARFFAVNSKPNELSSHKHRNFFRRRTKSLESFPRINSTNKIFVLKPGSASRSPETEAADKEKNTNGSQFSFAEIKRMLRHAMGKERRGVSIERSASNGGYSRKGASLGWRAPNRNHFYMERFDLFYPGSKRGEAGGESRGEGSKSFDISSPGSKKGESGGESSGEGSKSFYLSSPGSKKGESGVESRGDGSKSFDLPSPGSKKGESGGESRGECSKSFDLSSLGSKRDKLGGELRGGGSRSRRLGESDIYIEAKKHLSEMLNGGDGNTVSVIGNISAEPLGRILSLPEYNIPTYFSRENHSDETSITAQRHRYSRILVKNAGDSLKIRQFHEDTVVSEVRSEIETAAELTAPEEENDINISSEGTLESNNDESGLMCLKSHLSVEHEMSSPSLDRATTGTEDSVRAVEKIEQPSPVSVLEPLFADDAISPAVEMEIRPLRIVFEQESPGRDPAVCTRISLEDEESAYEYVEAVLLGSGLNWAEFLPRWLSSYPILDSSLFDEVELFSSRPRHDQKLLFDSANVALDEVYRRRFGGSGPDVRAGPTGMDLIHDVWEWIEGRLLREPMILDGLVKEDLAGPDRWAGPAPFVAEAIVCEVEAMFLDELVEEILAIEGV